MKVLILGGTGFVGSHTARAFVAAGHEVALPVRPASPRDPPHGLPIEWVPGDLCDRASLQAAGDRGFPSSWAMAGPAFSRLPFSPPGGLNVVDVRDVARAHVLALSAPRGGNYIIGGENLTNRAFVDLLRDVLHLSAPALPLPR